LAYAAERGFYEVTIALSFTLYVQSVREHFGRRARGEDSILLQINGKRKRHQKVRPCALFHPILKHAAHSTQGVNTAGCINPQTFFIITKAEQEKYCRRAALCCVYLSLHTQVSTHTHPDAEPEKDIALLLLLARAAKYWMEGANEKGKLSE
jgi:hypothetical protein